MTRMQGCVAGTSHASESPVLRQLTSGLTIHTAPGKWKWQQLFVADDASAILAHGLDALGNPSLWLWTRSVKQPEPASQVSLS